MVLTSSADSTARLWNAHIGNCTSIFEGHTHYCRSAVFSPDMTHILTCSSDWTAKIWSIASAVCERTLTGHIFWLNSAIYSPDETKWILTASRDHTAKLWCSDSGQCLATVGSAWNEDASSGMHSDFVISAIFVPAAATPAVLQEKYTCTKHGVPGSELESSENSLSTDIQKGIQSRDQSGPVPKRRC